MANFCNKCGTRLSPGAKFCPTCGQKMMSAAQAPGQSNLPPQPQQAAPQPQKVPRKASAPSAPRKMSSISPILCAILAVVMLAELVIIAYVRPGILKKDPGTSGYMTESENGSSFFGGDPGSIPGDVMISDDEEAIFSQLDYATEEFPEGPLMTSEIAFRYSDEQIESAPVRTARVSPENPVADFGDVKIDLKSWNLENEEDELILRDLPEVESEEDDGLTFKCWDISLASGQDEFTTSVAITVPRTSGAPVDCVSFNEETGEWEDEYSELSADGTQRTIYVTHFCVKGYYFDKEAFELKEGDLTVELDHGIYAEKVSKKENSGFGKSFVNRMILPVKLDQDRMWQMYQKKDMDDAGKFPELVRIISKGVDNTIIARRMYDKSDTLNTYFGYGGFATNIASLLQVAPGACEVIGAVCTVHDVMLTTIKVVAEAASGNTAFAGAVMDAALNHKLDITGMAVGAATPIAALISATAGLWFTVAGIVIFSVSIMYSEYEQNKEWAASSKMEDPLYLYRGYYKGGILRADFGGDKSKSQRLGSGKASEYQYVTMKKPASMEPDKFNKLAAVVNKKGLGRVSSPNNGWTEAFVEIIKAYPGEASCLDKVLDELYLSYASVFWELPDSAIYAYRRDYKASADIEWLTDSDKETMIRNYVFELKIQTREMLQEAAKTVQREEYKEQLRKMKKEAVPLLNTQLVFHVQDTGLAAGESFRNSVYYYDWTTAKENRGLDGKNGKFALYKVSMQFEGAEKPLFVPVDYSGEEGDFRKYYPYSLEGGFLPKMPFSKDSDVVFKCTFYHYMMMGCPKAMIFTNMKDPNAKKERVEIDLSEVDGKKKQVDIYLKVGGEREEETYELLLKEDPSMNFNRSSEAWGPDTHEAGDSPGLQQNATLRIEKNGKVTLTVPEFRVKRERLYYDYDKGAYDRWEYSRNAFTCTGVFADTNLILLTEIPGVSGKRTYSTYKSMYSKESVYWHEAGVEKPVVFEEGKNQDIKKISYIYLDRNKETGKVWHVTLGVDGLVVQHWKESGGSGDKESEMGMKIEFDVVGADTDQAPSG